jgi:hypothetical protein
MQYDAFEIVEAKRTAHGIAGAKKMTLRFVSDERELTVKWKSAPQRTAEVMNNVPRKEVAAYQIQKWFLDPEDFVAPTTVTRCIPLEVFRAIEPGATATYKAETCVFGAMSMWLEQVDLVETLVDHELFDSDPIYAKTLGNVNVLGYLIEHRDSRKANFLVSTVPGERRVFSIDNGLAFGANVFNYFKLHMAGIRVPALPKEAIERLHEISFDDAQALGVLAQYERDETGALLSVPPDANLDPRKGSRLRPDVFQYGLSREEISDLWERLGKLLAGVNDGKIAVR